jgi:flagellar biosynthesis/type III secretory pathway protein FliH
MRTGMAKGLAKGMERGLEKGREEVARRAFAKGLPLDVIRDLTGLDIEKIKEL